MGFFSNLKSIRLSKRGYEFACNEDLANAIKCFDEAYLEADDMKTATESKTWYHICLALCHLQNGDIAGARKEYSEFKSAQEIYVFECQQTPGFGTRTRFAVWEQQIKDFVKRHGKFFMKIRESEEECNEKN